MEQKKSTLKEIKATVMPQTAEGLQMLMEETGLRSTSRTCRKRIRKRY